MPNALMQEWTLVIARTNGRCKVCGATWTKNVDELWWRSGEAMHKGCLPAQFWPAQMQLPIPASEHIASIAPQLISAIAQPSAGESRERSSFPPPTPPAVTLQPGYFTVCLGNGEYRTLKVQAPDPTRSFAPQEWLLSYLCGSDNTRDYRGFAFVKPGNQIVLWKAFRSSGSASLVEAAARCLADPLSAGEAFALASNQCWRCGRTLTVPASIHRGLGPICAGLVNGDNK